MRQRMRKATQGFVEEVDPLVFEGCVELLRERNEEGELSLGDSFGFVEPLIHAYRFPFLLSRNYFVTL